MRGERGSGCEQSGPWCAEVVVILSDERRALDSAGGQEDEVDCITGLSWSGEKESLLSESPISATRQERKIRR